MCEDCKDNKAYYGLRIGCSKWCKECSKKYENSFCVSGKWCEDCKSVRASYGINGTTARWCKSCSLNHKGSDRSFNNAIILCDCPNFYYSDPTWIITHELSHFVLYFLEFNMNVIEDLVHKYDAKYDQCRDNYSDLCKPYVAKLRIDHMAYDVSVMPPYEFAVGISKLTNNEVKVSEPLIELGKAVTKWWTSGKITDGDYSNTLGLLAVENQETHKKNYQVMFKDGPTKNEITWQEILLTDGAPDNNETIMTNLREKLKIDESFYQQPDFTGLPDWFKQTAQWWVDDQITNEDFIRSVKYLKDAGIIRDHQLDQ